MTPPPNRQNSQISTKTTDDADRRKLRIVLSLLNTDIPCNPRNVRVVICDLPSPTHSECESIPQCSDSDVADIPGNGLCSTLEMHSSCLPGFMFVDSNDISAPRPTAISNMIPASFSATMVSRTQFKLQRECYGALQNVSLASQCPSKCYPLTRACCPGHYCPLSRPCMIPCHEIGSYCPSSFDDMVSIERQCFPLGIPPVGPSMGCGGARVEESICPRGIYLFWYFDILTIFLSQIRLKA